MACSSQLLHILNCILLLHYNLAPRVCILQVVLLCMAFALVHFMSAFAHTYRFIAVAVN